MVKKEKTSLIEPLTDAALRPRFIELSFDQMMKMSVIIERAGAKGLTKEESMTVIMRGQELGISPIASHEVISMIKGKKSGSSFAYHYSLILALIRKNLPEAQINFIQRNSVGCIIEARRSKKEEFMKFSFLEADAKTAGLLGKANWINYPTDLHLSKAVLRMGRILFSDVLLGLKDTPETIMDWEEPIKSKSKKSKKNNAIDVEVEEKDYSGLDEWDKMDKEKQEKREKKEKKALEAFKKTSKKSGTLKLSLKPKKQVTVIPGDTDGKIIEEAKKTLEEVFPEKKLKEELDENEELNSNIEALQDHLDEKEKEEQKALEKTVIVKPFDPNKKLSFKKAPGKKKGIDFKKLSKESSKKQEEDRETLKKDFLKATSKLSKKPDSKPKKEEPKKEEDVTLHMNDKDWEKPILELSSYKYVEQFELCESKSKQKSRYDVLTKQFIELIEAYMILENIEDGSPFDQKFREIIGTKSKTMPVKFIYQKAFQDTFPNEAFHDLLKGYYDLTETTIKKLISIGEANTGSKEVDFWRAFIEAGFSPENNKWISKFFEKNKLFSFGEKVMRMA